MELNEIKKALYKQKPVAIFRCADSFCLKYIARLKTQSGLPHSDIYFEIPLNDIGDAKFETTMESQLLIRYIVSSEQHVF